MPKMTAEERKSIETAMRWQSHQKYDRNTVLMLMGHIEAVEWEYEAQLKINRQLVDLEEERKIEDRRVQVPRYVAIAHDALQIKDEVEAGYTVCNIIKCPMDDLLEPAQVIKKYFLRKPHQLMKFFINGFTVEQTPDDYVFQQYLEFLGTGQYAAADAMEMVLGCLEGKAELLQKMRAVERPLPF